MDYGFPFQACSNAKEKADPKIGKKKSAQSFCARSLPKGPFGTKNAIARKTAAVFYYPYRFAVIFPRKNSIRITIAVVNYYRGSELLSR